MPGTTKLDVYNTALRHMGDAPLATLTDDVPARYELDRVWLTSLDYMLRQGAWRFATKATAIALAADAVTVPGYTYTVALPNDWIYTHSIFTLVENTREVPIDVREEHGKWAARMASFTVRYVSTAYYDPSLWTPAFSEAFAAYMAREAAYRITGGMADVQMLSEDFDKRIGFALQVDAIPTNPWLRFQLSAQFIKSVRFVLEHGGWRFARKTVPLVASGSPIAGTLYRYPLPADWVRTLEVQATGYAYLPMTPGELYRAVPFQEEAGSAIYTETSNATLTYLSTDGYDATRWPEAFSETVLRHCMLTDGNASAKDLQAFAAELREAEFRDNYRDRVRVNQIGQVVRSRWGLWNGYYPDHSGAQNPPPP